MRVKTTLVTAALVAVPTVAAISMAAPSEAAGKYYSSCDNLHRDFKHGVAISAKAAARQVRAGYGRPATGPRAKAAYRTNSSRLDRDKDGTACEA